MKPIECLHWKTHLSQQNKHHVLDLPRVHVYIHVFHLDIPGPFFSIRGIWRHSSTRNCPLRGCDAGRLCWAWDLKLQSFCTFVQCMLQGYARISVKPAPHDAMGAQRPSKLKPETSAPLMAPLISSTSSISSANDSKDILFHDPLKSPIRTNTLIQTPTLKAFSRQSMYRQFHKQECMQPIPTPRTHSPALKGLQNEGFVCKALHQHSRSTHHCSHNSR